MHCIRKEASMPAKQFVCFNNINLSPKLDLAAVCSLWGVVFGPGFVM